MDPATILDRRSHPDLPPTPREEEYKHNRHLKLVEAEKNKREQAQAEAEAEAKAQADATRRTSIPSGIVSQGIDAHKIAINKETRENAKNFFSGILAQSQARKAAKRKMAKEIKKLNQALDGMKGKLATIKDSSESISEKVKGITALITNFAPIMGEALRLEDPTLTQGVLAFQDDLINTLKSISVEAKEVEEKTIQKRLGEYNKFAREQDNLPDIKTTPDPRPLDYEKRYAALETNFKNLNFKALESSSPAEIREFQSGAFNVYSDAQRLLEDVKKYKTETGVDTI